MMMMMMMMVSAVTESLRSFSLQPLCPRDSQLVQYIIKCNITHSYGVNMLAHERHWKVKVLCQQWSQFNSMAIIY